MWIVFEGLDGAGTTTQARRLARHLRARGIEVHETAEPSAGRIGRLLRDGLRSEFTMRDGARLSPEVLALLFAADRVHHALDEIEPALEANRWVVCDRYVHSSLAYQGSELPMDWVAAINRRAPSPDLTIFLDVPARVAISRLEARGSERELYEHEALLADVRTRYLQAFANVADCPHHTIDGTLDEDAVFDEVSALLGPFVDRVAD